MYLWPPFESPRDLLLLFYTCELKYQELLCFWLVMIHANKTYIKRILSIIASFFLIIFRLFFFKSTLLYLYLSHSYDTRAKYKFFYVSSLQFYRMNFSIPCFFKHRSKQQLFLCWGTLVQIEINISFFSFLLSFHSPSLFSNTFHEFLCHIVYILILV